MPLPRPGAMLLDLDDTLLDTSASSAAAWDVVAGASAAALDTTPQALRSRITEVNDAYWRDPARTRADHTDAEGSRLAVAQRVVASFDTPDPHGELADAMARRYGEVRLDRLRLYDDVLPTLEALRGRGVALALLSNGDAALQRSKVERFGLAPRFRAVLIEGEMGYGKPTARVYERALDACGVPAARAWCVGDHLEWEVAAPQRMGIVGVWIDRRGAGLPIGTQVRPDLVVRSLHEVLDHVPV